MPAAMIWLSRRSRLSTSFWRCVSSTSETSTRRAIYLQLRVFEAIASCPVCQHGANIGREWFNGLNEIGICYVEPVSGKSAEWGMNG